MMYSDLDKPLYDAEATTLFPNETALLFQRPSPHGTMLTDLTAESGSSAAPTPVYKFAISLPSDPKEEEIFNDMIKNWIVNSSEELGPASSTSPAEESQKVPSQESTNPQVSFLGLEPGPIPPFPPLDAIPPFDPSALEYSSIDLVTQLPFDSLTSLAFTNLETMVGITPNSIAQSLPYVPQSALLQAPMNPPAHKAQEDVAPRRSNVLSSILIGSDVPSKSDSVRSMYMKVPVSTLGKRSERGKREGSKPSLPLSGSAGSGAIKGRTLLPSHSFLPASGGSSTAKQIPFTLDPLSILPTAAFPFPPPDASLGNVPTYSPPLDSLLSLPSYLFNVPCYHPQPAKFPTTDGLSNHPGYFDFRTSSNEMGDPCLLLIPATGPPTTNRSGLLSSNTGPDAPLVNIENRCILKRPSFPVSTPMHDTEHPFVYEHRANPIRNHQDAMRVMVGTHSLTHGERDTIERISGEQRRLIIERKVDCDAAGGTRRRR